jgi:hypothetical protein
MSQKKIIKYGPIVKYIKEHYKLNVKLLILALSPTFSDLEVTLNSLTTLVNPNAEYPYMIVRLLLGEINDLQRKLRSCIQDEDLMNKVFEMEFGGSSTQSLEEERKIDFTNTSINYKSGQLSLGNTVRDEGEIIEIFRKLMADTQLVNAISEQRTDDLLIMRTYHQLDEINRDENMYNLNNKIKPSFHLHTHNFTTQVLTENLKFDKREQNQIYDMLHFVHDLNPLLVEELPFIQDIASNFLKNIEKSVLNKTLFETGVVLTQDIDAKFKEKYHNYRDECKKNKTPNMSFIGFLNVIDPKELNNIYIPTELESRSVRTKILKIPINELSNESKKCWEKAHNSQGKEKRISNPLKSTIDIENSEHFENFLTFLSGNDEMKRVYPIKEFLKAKTGSDAPILEFLKQSMIDDWESPLNLILNTRCAFFSWQQTLIAEQLMHFMQLSLPSNTFSLFTCGHPNQMYIVANSFHDKGKDVGKAFMSCGLTNDIRWLTPVYGKINSFPITVNNVDCFFYVTNWRRLDSQKVTFLKDSFYTTLVTGFNGLTRVINSLDLEDPDAVRAALKHFYSLKVLVATSSNQRVAEMLADMRYAIMAAISEYSMVSYFLLDKLKPPYKNCFEAWIVSRIKNVADVAEEFRRKELVFIKQPVYVNKKRHEDSIGGRIMIPSIWTRYINVDLQDFLDDMFLYVHTAKEPANIHHENIKAINTIIEYQKHYDSLSDDRKQGFFKNCDAYKSFFLDKNILGFSREILRHSVKGTISQLPSTDWGKIWKDIKNEPLSEVTSTKAVIPEYQRVLKEVQITDKKYNKIKNEILEKKKANDKFSDGNFIKEFKNRFGLESITIKSAAKIKTENQKGIILQGTNRCKVHDATADFIEIHPEMNTVFQVACWNIFHNSNRVTADICIKAQYGAKREFYVLNFGAKMMARVLENVFHAICDKIPNEMISVPGDKKILVMQEKLNATILNKTASQKIFYVNGDCTKWSAAELMECLYCFIDEFKAILPEECVNFCLTVICGWASKEITIPTSILDKNVILTEKTDYLKGMQFVLNSTQNFLQGMFNYLSSLKAVCCSNYTYRLWKQINPKSKLIIDHLEHSDDYVLMISTESRSELSRFRALHRMVMKCHGFNDSVKKTNTQQFLMEFISLCSFNGHMTYPHIKKCKEVGLNLGCTGYRDDMDGVSSRVGEAVRVGLPFSSAYFMQRVHQYNLIRAYSIHKGGYNHVVPYEAMFNLPVEIFGIPDLHPVFLYLCKGSPNNYRLYKYTNNTDLLKYLFYKELYHSEDFSKSEDDSLHPEGLRLFHPQYSFDIENKLIKKIRNTLNIPFEDIKDFWDKHKTYNFIKPKNHEHLLSWLKCMYYKNTFALAYSRSSRSQITLRLSTFTKTKCLIDPGDVDKLFTIKDFMIESTQLKDLKVYQQQVSKHFTDQQVELLMFKTLLNCDSTVTSLYSMFKYSKVLYKGVHNKDSVACLSPHKLHWVHVDNSPQTILQYIFNFDDFKKDLRPYRSLASLEADKRKLESHYQQELTQECDMPTIKSVYKDIVMSKQTKNLCMSYSHTTATLEDFVRMQVEFGTYHKIRLKLITKGVTEAINPHTGEAFYKKTISFTKDNVRLMLDDLGLVYALLKHGYKLKPNIIKAALKNLVMDTFESQILDKRKMTSSELFENFSVAILQQLGAKPSEIKTFAFLKAFIEDNPDEMLAYLSDKFSYSYVYLTVPSSLENVCSEIVQFQYINEYYTAYLLKVTRQIIVYTTSLNKSMLVNAYLIACKLFNQISQLKFEQFMGVKKLKDLHEHILVPIELQEYLGKELRYFDVDTKRSVLLLDCSMGSPFLFGTIQNTMPIKMNRETVSKPFNIDWEKSTVTSTTGKVFTLPILTYKQTNLSTVIGDLNVNGLNINWWLTHDRITDFFHNRDIQVEKALFDTLDDFEAPASSSINLLQSWVSASLTELSDEIKRPIQEPEIKTVESGLLPDNIADELQKALSGVEFSFEVAESSDDDEELPEEERLTIQSEIVEPTLIGLSDFEKLPPDFKIEESFTIKNMPSSINQILNKGDPTEFVILNSYIDKFQIINMKPHDKIITLVKLKSLISKLEFINDKTKLLVLLLAKSIIQSFPNNMKFELNEDWVAYTVNGNLGVYMLLENIEDNDLMDQARKKGSIIEPSGLIGWDIYIKIPSHRLQSWVQTSQSTRMIERFINLKPIEDAYFKLFKRKYHKLLDAYTLLSEL